MLTITITIGKWAVIDLVYTHKSLLVRVAVSYTSFYSKVLCNLYDMQVHITLRFTLAWSMSSNNAKLNAIKQLFMLFMELAFNLV